MRPAIQAAITALRSRMGRRLRQLGRGAGVVVLGAALFVLVSMAPIACTTTVHPPAAVEAPVSVFLLDHGRTPSLVLPGDDGLVRYVYGDWRYYAQGDKSSGSGLLALLWPTRGALGRRELTGPTTAEGVRAATAVPIERVFSIEVERRQVRELQQRLDSLFQQNVDTAVWNEGADLWFVHHPDSYTWFYNSNHRVADWLGALGCTVRGPAYYSRWELGEAEP